MKTLLHINSSLFSGAGQSSQLAQQFVAGWKSAHPDGEVIIRDIGAEPVPHLDAERFTALISKAEERTPAQQEIVAYADALLDEVRRADIIVLGLPMYNFGVPSSLKAYFDHLARAGVTFRYTENGAVGLLGGKKVYVFATRGGAYQGTPADSQTPFVRTFLSFIGLDDIEFVYAERLNMGEDSKQSALRDAQHAIGQLVEPLRDAA
ncbi:MAG TPA: NAD(P)H-dependent oxidoreductase [Noviherbaspirillum sp.]|nr:NAD(P)H-dependent oxidoreductase [Noviherbaspirillum sp.]